MKRRKSNLVSPFVRSAISVYHSPWLEQKLRLAYIHSTHWNKTIVTVRRGSDEICDLLSCVIPPGN